MKVKTSLSKIGYHALWDILERFWREDLRKLAKKHGIRQGANKYNTVANLVEYAHLLDEVVEIEIGI